MSCGPFGEWGDWIVWDRPFGLDLTVPGKLHDEEYKHPNGKTKAEVDYRFYERILEEVAKSPWYLWPIHRPIGWVYYKGVSMTAGGRIAWELCRLREGIEVVAAKVES